MLHRCKHTHVDQRADAWTNIATAGEMVASLISDAYWLGNVLDITGDLEPEFLGLSYYGLTAGVLLAFISASGAAYSHRALNTIHQASDNEDHKQDTEREPLRPKTQHHLTLLEKLALLGDFISHTGEIAGPITFVVNLATHEDLSRPWQLLTQGVASFFGGISSVANVRSCKDAIIASKIKACAHSASEDAVTACNATYNHSHS